MSSEKTCGKFPRVILSRVSLEQFEQINNAAYIAGMSRCKYIRARVTGQTVVSKLDAKIIRELSRIGGLLKHLYSKGEPTGPALGELRTTLEHLRQQQL